MSDVAAMLTCSEYILCCLRPRLTRTRGTKVTFVKGISTRGISTEDASRSTCIDAGLSGARY